MRSLACGEMTGPLVVREIRERMVHTCTHRSVPSSKPPDTFRFLARSTSSGIKSRAAPTKMAAVSDCGTAGMNRLTDRQGHAALSSSAEGGTGNGVKREVLVGCQVSSTRPQQLTVGHDDSVVLGTEVGLDTLALGRGTLIDVVTCVVTSNKRDRLDVWVITDAVDSSCGTVNAKVSGRGRKAGITHTLMTPGGMPARSHSSAMIIVAPGSRSEGLTTRVLPVTVAKAADQRTILG